MLKYIGNFLGRLVGVAGFEPATPTSRTKSVAANYMRKASKHTTYTAALRSMFSLRSRAQVQPNQRALRKAFIDWDGWLWDWGEDGKPFIVSKDAETWLAGYRAASSSTHQTAQVRG